MFMDYKKQYDLLISNAKNRLFESDQYREQHHIIPRCLGGSDESENLVELTPEEHYVAHQLLVKMYPNHQGLVWAAIQMTGHGNGQRNNNNKMYGWIKKKYQKECKKRVGKKNGSYGRSWYHHPDTLHNIKCKPNEVPEGYIKGRKLVPDSEKVRNKIRSHCKICDTGLVNPNASYCKDHQYHPQKIATEELFEEFLNSDHKTLTSFATEKGFSQPNITARFKRHIPNYREILNNSHDKLSITKTRWDNS